MRANIGASDIMIQLKDKSLKRLLLLDDVTKLIVISPMMQYIKVGYISDDNQPVGFIDAAMLSDEEKETALVLEANGFGPKKPKVREILIRKIESDDQHIYFNASIASLVIRNYNFSRSLRNKYQLVFDTATNKFDCKLMWNYGSIGDLLLNSLNDFYDEYIEERAYTEVMEESLEALAPHRSYLEEIGFIKLIEDNRAFIRTRWSGQKYLFDVLMKYLLLVDFAPDVIKNYRNGNREEVEKLLFVEGNKVYLDFIGSRFPPSPF